MNGRERQIDFTELGKLVPFKYPVAGSRGVMAMELVSDGPTIVLKLKPYEKNKSSFEDTRSSTEFKAVTPFFGDQIILTAH